MMINARAVRRFTLGDKTYQKGAAIALPHGQFADLEPLGLVERSATAPPHRLAAKIGAARRRTPLPVRHQAD